MSETVRESAWNCNKCSSTNFSSRISCFKCSLSKKEHGLQNKGKAALDWECFKCKASNSSFRDSCFKCSISRFESDDIRALREGIPWVCRFCKIENRVTNFNCLKCKRPQDMADVIPPRRCYSPPRGMMGPRDHGPNVRRPFSPPPLRGSFPGGRKLLPDPPSRPISPLNKLIEKKPEAGLSITISNNHSNHPNEVSLNHSTTNDDKPSPVKRRRMNYRDEGIYYSAKRDEATRNIGPGNMGPRNFCRRDVEPKTFGPREMGPRDMCHRDMGTKDLDQRFVPRNRYVSDPRDRFSHDSRDGFDPDRRDRSSGTPDGFTCCCGNFNKMYEPACVKCGRPNKVDMRRDAPLGNQMENSSQHTKRPLSSQRGGRRSPPRSDKAKKVGPQSKNKSITKKSKTKESAEVVTKKKFSAWKCKNCPIVNYDGRGKCFQCFGKQSEVEDKTVVIPDSEELHRVLGNKPLSEVFDDYIALYSQCQENKDKKFKEGDVDLRKIFKVKKVALRRLKKAENKEIVKEVETCKIIYDTMVQLFAKAHRDLNTEQGWQCPASDCDGFNFSKRTACYKCDAKKATSETPENDNSNIDASTEKISAEKPVEGSKVTDNTTENSTAIETGIDDTTDTVKEATSDDVEESEPPVDFMADY